MTTIATTCKDKAFPCRKCKTLTLLTELYSFFCKHNFQPMINRLQSDTRDYDEQCGLIYKTALCTNCAIKFKFIERNGYYYSYKWTQVTLHYNANASLWIDQRLDPKSCATCMSN
jgi:hypothetical protein